MMLHIMAYAVAVTAALTVVGHCLERLAGLHRLSRRMAWITTMVVSVLFPLGMMLGARVAATHHHTAAHSQTAPLPATAATPPAAADQVPIWKLAAPSDSQIIVMWMVASVAFGLYLSGASLLLRLRAARWQRTNVLGHEVLVSEVTGPALLGVLSPRIVVPRWLLQQPVATQRLILEHECQHMAARDPLLMVAGLLVITAIPWNPLLWWQWRQMRNAMEIDCDARVLCAGAEPEIYAQVLIEVTRRVTRIFPGALAMSEPVASLERRIDQLVPDAGRHVRMQTAAVLGLAAAGAGAAMALNAPVLPAFGVARAALVAPPGATALQLAASTPQFVAEITTPARASEPQARRKVKKVKSVSGTESFDQSQDGEASMNKSKSMAVTIAALGATVIAQAQTAEPTAAQSPSNPAAQPAAQSVSQPARARPRISPEQIIAMNDLNKDGVVTKEEAATVNGNLNLMWDGYDMNHDGKVDAAEFTRATLDMFEGTALERITGDRAGHMALNDPEKTIANNDLDGDGIVTKEEATKANKGLIKMWDSFDLNRDGKVDAAEIRKAQPY